MALISCNSVALAYEGNTIVKDLNFTVNSGDYLCIVGENGSGKSNLGFALYDLTVHLTDKQKPDPQWYINYSNLDNNNKIGGI